jgi:tetratricopeptide (TPR) repeat protein
MRVADLCEMSGHPALALTVLDDAEKARRDLGTSVDHTVQGRLAATLQRRYRTLLARLFDAMMKEGRAEDLWRLARSRAAHAIEHSAPAIMAQCLAWMAAAAVLGEKYDLAKDHARDAIMTAHSCRQRFHEGFANLYLGHAERHSGRLAEAAHAYSRAISLLGARKPGPIHAVAMLSLAQVVEQLGDPEDARTLYTSSRDLARAMHEREIEEAASYGERRLGPST